MSGRFDKTCTICQKHYEYCPTCGRFLNYPRWMNLFCSQNCYELYNTLNDYYAKHSTREDTLQKLQKLDLSDYSNFTLPYKHAIDGIKNEIDSQN